MFKYCVCISLILIFSVLHVTIEQGTNGTVTTASSNATLNVTTSPTLNVTTSPTLNVTTSPTLNETTSPTLNVTTSPTLNETTSPTLNVTTSPTLNETTSPTLNATTSPTVNETTSPSVNETTNPTSNETTSPSSNTTESSSTTTVNPACFSIPKYGKCPPPTEVNLTLPSCANHNECTGNEICCPDAQDSKHCTAPLTKTQGTCPPPDEISSGSSCYLDDNCKTGRKCCKVTNCNYQCADAKPPTIVPDSTDKPTTSSSCKSISKYGKCPTTPTSSTETCTSHSDCMGNKLCCGSTSKTCSDPESKKYGECPPSYSLINEGSSYCYTDENCGTNRKCCIKTPCSYRCSDVLPQSTPADEPSKTPNPQCFSIPKYGKCPINPTDKSLPCNNDAKCPGNKVCCKGYCSEPDTKKKGKCPAWNNLINKGKVPCYSDLNCGGSRRCCEYTPCQYYCSGVIF